MKQYSILKEKNDPLNSLIGKSYNQKSQFEAEKILKEIHKGYFSSWSKAIVYCIDPKTKEILGVGGSSLLYDKKTKRIQSDLILDNFGKFMSAWFTRVSGVNSNAVLQANDASFGSYAIYVMSGGGAEYNTFIGARIQLGSGSVIARSDFTVTTPFVTSPESLILNVLSTGIFTSGTGKITSIITGHSPTGGSGTIAETGLYFSWGVLPVGNFRLVMMYHDLISPTVSFSPAQQIITNYTIQL